MQINSFTLVPRFFARTACATLKQQLPQYLASALEPSLTKAYLKRLPELTAEKTIGAKLTMRLVVANVALFDVLLSAGIERAQAIEMIAETISMIQKESKEVAEPSSKRIKQG